MSGRVESTGPDGLAVFEQLLRAPAAPGSEGVPVIEQVADWRAAWSAGIWQSATPFETAARAGFAADRVAWAMGAGYQAALHALLLSHGLPFEPTGTLAFCVSEPGGNRPRDLRSRAVQQPDGRWRLNGEKQWTTLGSACDAFLVVAVAEPEPEPEPKPLGAGVAVEATDRAAELDLRLFRVPASAPGVRLAPMPPTRFVPELPHTRMVLENVDLAADAALPGEGWSLYGKAFGTWEDILVTTAVLAHLLREARHRQWPMAFMERSGAALAGLRSLAATTAGAGGAQSPTTHVLLAGALAQVHALYDDAGALMAPAADGGDAAAARWLRDASLFGVSAKARAARVARAWQQLSAGAAAPSS